MLSSLLAGTTVAAPMSVAAPQVGNLSKGNGLIAFVSDRSGNADIFTMWWDGMHPTNLTNNSAADTDPAWSPDGTKIAFTSDRTTNLEVWVMDEHGGNLVNLTKKAGAADSQPTWSPDGTKIAFTSDRAGSTDIWIMNADGTAPIRLTKTSAYAELDPAWAPNGSRIAYTSNKSGNLDVWSMTPTGTGAKNLTKNAAADSQPAWSPDALRIAFVTDRDANNEVYRMSATGTQVTRLTTSPSSDSQPAYSPNRGTKVLYRTDRTGDGEVFFMRATNGSSTWTLSHASTADDSQPDWQPLPPYQPAGWPIDHVVIIYMENQSFDSVLGRLCVQDQRCDGTLQGQLLDGSLIDLPAAADIVPDSPHSYNAQQDAINGGLMNGFSELKFCDPPGYTCFQAYAPEQIPTISDLARTYAISDRTFETDTVGSFGSHLNLAATILGGYYTAVHNTAPGGQRLAGGGCDSNDDGEWNPNVYQDTPNLPDQPTCVPFPDGTGAFAPTEAHWIDTIMNRLDEASVSWKIYDTNVQGFADGYGWAICPTFADCRYTPQFNKLVDRATFLTDVAGGTLSPFSILIPDPPNSQHNSRSMMQGDNWLAQQVGAVMNSPYWDSTAIFLTWDDCGCFYDHVVPPEDLGIREPFLIISPYARPAFTDSNVASFTSMLAFTERVFGVAPLSNIDRDAYYYQDAFDFGQDPLPPIVLPQHEVPEASIQWLIHHPVNDEDDPT